MPDPATPATPPRPATVPDPMRGASGVGRALRVLMICPSYQPQEAACGVGDYSRALAEEWAAGGAEVRVVCGASYTGNAAAGVTIVRRMARWSWREAIAITRDRELLGADIVNMQYTPSLYGNGHGFKLLPLLLRALRRPPVVVTFHSLTGAGLMSKLWAATLLVCADHLIAANEEVASMIRRRAGRLADKLTLIPIGANIPVTPLAGDERERRREALGVGARDGSLICYFGLVYPGKGIETLLRAIPDVLEARPAARFVLVGAHPAASAAYAARLERLARDLEVSEAIVWTGFVPPDEASEILQSSDLMVLPFDEGASLRRGSLLAGLSHGLPIVAPLRATASSTLQDGVNLAVVPPRNPAALARRIILLLEQPEEAAVLRSGALDLAASCTWPAIAGSQRALFEQLARQ